MKRLLLPTMALLLANGGSVGAAELCIDCLSIRLDPPIVVRGPFADELDNAFVALRLKDGAWRGFSANGSTYAVDGPDVLAMRGERREVMSPGTKGSASECGRWLNSVIPGDRMLYGLVHQESGCDYAAGETRKSMAMAVSRDEGLTWTAPGDVITGRDQPRRNAITGEGDCTMVDGQDGYFYAYCLRNSDSVTIAARAPAADPAPGKWRKYRGGRWATDALGGDADSLGFHGVASAWLRDLARVALVVSDPWFGGLRLSLSADRAHFTDLRDPLLPVDAADWHRPAPTDLVAYVSLIDPVAGGNVVGNDFLLAMVYLPPGGTFADRYLVLQPVHLALEAEPQSPQTGVALTRWRMADGSSRTASGPVIERGATIDRRLGYLMTRPPDGRPSLKLEECLAGRRYALEADGACAREGTTRLRTAGWVYETGQPGTVPVYICALPSGDFISDAPECDGKGTVRARLGFALKN